MSNESDELKEYMGTFENPNFDNQNSKVIMNEQEPPGPLRRRKRKRDDGPEKNDLRQRARLFCKSPEQWRTVSRYSPKRLDEFIKEKQFDQQQVLYDTVFGFIHHVWSFGIDKISGGNGFVQEQLECDISLRQSIEEEGQHFVSLLTNKYKILALTCVDTFNGKKTQRASDPEIIQIKDGNSVREDNRENRQSELDQSDARFKTTDSESTHEKEDTSEQRETI